MTYRFQRITKRPIVTMPDRACFHLCHNHFRLLIHPAGTLMRIDWLQTITTSPW